jgi:hypothetical protein
VCSSDLREAKLYEDALNQRAAMARTTLSAQLATA